MKRPETLPPILRLEPFSVAEARDLGVSVDRLRARDLQHPFHGVRAVEVDLSSTRGRCRAYAPRLRPGDVFSHETAARLWGLPLPLYARSGLFVSAPSPRRAPRAQGVVGSQLTLMPGDVSLIDGLPVTSPSLTWSILAGRIRVEDLIAVGDSIVTPPFRSLGSLGTLGDLQDQVDRARSQRGQRSRDAAIGEVRVGPLARTESLVRIVCGRAGIPEPELKVGPRGLMPDLR